MVLIFYIQKSLKNAFSNVLLTSKFYDYDVTFICYTFITVKMIRDEILADFVKEFPWIYDKKDKGHKDLHSNWKCMAKSYRKIKKFQFWYGSRRSYSTICKPPETLSTENVQLSEEKKKSGQGSKEVENKWW